MYFVIHEIFVIHINTLLCIAKEAFLNINNILCSELSSNLFYTLTIVYFRTKCLDKAPALLFMFVRDMPPFNSTGYGIPGSLRGLHCCFSVDKCPETRKERQFMKSKETRHTRISDCRKETTSEQSSSVAKFNTGFISHLPLMQKLLLLLY